MASNLADTLQKKLQDACSDPTTKIPGLILTVIDRKGNLLSHSSAGVRQVGSKESLDKDALCWFASCTKLITVIAVFQLVEQGKLNLHSPVHDILPEIKELEKGYKNPITLHHLITHTAGMSYPFFNQDTKNWFDERGLKSFGCKKASLMAPLNAEPGTRWEYGCSIDWAGLAVEKVSGMDLDTYFKKYIFEPLGIQRITLKPQTGLPGNQPVTPILAGMNFRDKNQDGKMFAQEHVIEQDESKIEVLYGGAGSYGNAADYVQILVALLNDGKHPKTGKQILQSQSVQLLFKDQLDEKLVKDLYRTIPGVQAEFSGDVDLPGDPKNWTYAGQKMYTNAEKEHSLVYWAGIANHFWLINHELGIAAMIQAQVFPFNDPQIVGLFFGEINDAIQHHVMASMSSA